MPESYTPKEINDYINSHNKGPKFDPYGSEELSNRLRTNKAEGNKGADLFHAAEQDIAKNKQTQDEIVQLKERAGTISKEAFEIAWGEGDVYGILEALKVIAKNNTSHGLELGDDIYNSRAQARYKADALTIIFEATKDTLTHDRITEQASLITDALKRTEAFVKIHEITKDPKDLDLANESALAFDISTPTNLGRDKVLRILGSANAVDRALEFIDLDPREPHPFTVELEYRELVGSLGKIGNFKAMLDIINNNLEGQGKDAAIRQACVSLAESGDIDGALKLAREITADSTFYPSALLGVYKINKDPAVLQEAIEKAKALDEDASNIFLTIRLYEASKDHQMLSKALSAIKHLSEDKFTPLMAIYEINKDPEVLELAVDTAGDKSIDDYVENLMQVYAINHDPAILQEALRHLEVEPWNMYNDPDYDANDNEMQRDSEYLDFVKTVAKAGNTKAASDALSKIKDQQLKARATADLAIGMAFNGEIDEALKIAHGIEHVRFKSVAFAGISGQLYEIAERKEAEII